MKIKILEDFQYGSVSDPTKMVAGNTQEAPKDVTIVQLNEWQKRGWIEIIDQGA
jgi:hypothetical protein